MCVRRTHHRCYPWSGTFGIRSCFPSMTYLISQGGLNAVTATSSSRRLSLLPAHCNRMSWLEGLRSRSIGPGGLPSTRNDMELFPVLTAQGQLRSAVSVAYCVLQNAIMGNRPLIYACVYRAVLLLIGAPILAGLLLLAWMQHVYFPESPRGLDTSSVSHAPLCPTVTALMRFTVALRRRYREMRELGNNCCASTPDTAPEDGIDALRQHHSRLMQGAALTPYEANHILRDLLIIIRSIEEKLIGTDEERALITPVADLVGQASPTASQSHGRLTSPSEFVLRVVLSIALDQGWLDVIERARQLFEELVRNHRVPSQATVAQAVGDLCGLSYELENCARPTDVTLGQLKRVAKAIDAFRPEEAVVERCTLSSEISVLPIEDGDHRTRCLSMIRHSPGRKPQLIMTFVGTNSWSNWLINLDFVKVPLPHRYKMSNAVYVHHGFLGMLESVAYKDVAKDFDHIIIIGHSLGGALAQLAGLELAAERPRRRITVVTVASPRLLAVDTTMCKQKNTEVSSSVPHQHREDVLAEAIALPKNYRHFRGYLQPDWVPQLPPELLSFIHVGQRMPLNTGCQSLASFLGWGMWSYLFHSAEMYQGVLANPLIAQTHYYRPSP